MYTNKGNARGVEVIFSENRFQERELYLQIPELRQETAGYPATLHIRWPSSFVVTVTETK